MSATPFPQPLPGFPFIAAPFMISLGLLFSLLVILLGYRYVNLRRPLSIVMLALGIVTFVVGMMLGLYNGFQVWITGTLWIAIGAILSVSRRVNPVIPVQPGK